MIVVFTGIKADRVLIFDAEYNEGSLIQFAGILFKKINTDIFQIEKSLNMYVKLPENERVNRFIRDFTGITDDFLLSCGETIENARKKINELIAVDGDLLVVSHGVHNDRQTLLNNEIDFYVDAEGKEIEGICTYTAAKRLLKRDKRLGLLDIAADSGICLSNNHNAYDDALATISVFCLLMKLNKESKNEKNEKLL